MKNQFQNVLTLNFLYALITASVTTLLPLYLIEKGFQLESIGLIMAAMPVTFLIFRTLFSTIADNIGTRSIFFLNGVTSTLSILIYIVASSPFIFAIGKLMEGLKAASFWAVVRTEIFRTSPKGQVEKNAVNMVGVRCVGDAFGRFFVGFLVTVIAFQNTLLALGIISLLFFYLANDVREEKVKNKKFSDDILKKISRPRKFDFWAVSISLMLFGTLEYAASVFIFPVYMDVSLDMSYFEIGTFIGLMVLAYSFGVFIDVKQKLSFHASLVFAFLFGALPFFVITFIDKTLFLPLLLAIGFGFGMANSAFEKMVVWATSASKNVSTEVAVIHAPQRIFEIILMSMVGFVIAIFGFSGLFVLAGIIMVLFILNSWHISRKMDANSSLYG